jgi:pyridinium-3,5-bisthiocarboxylic acid mononucleotide nickel chelatase
VSAPPPVGRGWVMCAHGPMPLPAPATAHLLEGFELTPTSLQRELVTPTGAALLKGWGARVDKLLPQGVLSAVGWGAGSADLPDRPNLLRAMIFEAASSAEDKKEEKKKV